jgi:hypothetical protein
MDTSHSTTYRGPAYRDLDGNLHVKAGAIAEMITWLDEHQLDGMAPSIREALISEDPRTWAEVHAAGLVTDDDVISGWLIRQP